MKSEALEILRQAEAEREREGWVQDYALGDSDLWTFKHVKLALVDAFRMLRRVGGSVGPARLKAAWPAYQLEQGDFVQQSINKTLRPARSTASYSTAMTATRMEMVLTGWTDDEGDKHSAWLAGRLLSVPEYREKLEAWVFAELRGESSRDLCERKRWALRTMQWQRDKAAGMIAERLNAAGLEVW
jgi:hypothetical protein